MAVISKDLGAVTAYAAAVNRGYTGTKEEFETLMASYATVAQQAAESAQSAEQSAQSASGSATDAQTAQGTAQQAATDAQTAQASAQGYAQSAQQSAQSASQYAQSAESAKDTAVDAVDGFAAGAQQALDSVNQAGINWKSLAERQAENSEAYALGTRDGEDVGSSDPAYHNNAKYYAESVSASAQTASEAAQTATTKAGEAAQSASAAAESARTLTIDDTLTQSGQAADASETGNKITSLKEDLKSTITYDNVTMADLPYSEYHASGCTNGKYLNSSGEENTQSEWSISPFLILGETPTYYLKTGIASYNVKNCYYDSNREFLSYFDPNNLAGTYVLTPPQGAKFVRFTIQTADINDFTYHSQLFIDKVIPKYVDGCTKASDFKSTLTRGKYYDSTGNVQSGDAWAITKTYPVSEGDAISVKSAFGQYATCFDENMEFETRYSVSGTANASFTVPSGVAFVAFNVLIANIDTYDCEKNGTSFDAKYDISWLAMNKSAWQGKTYISHGDSITWRDGTTWGSGPDIGKIARGYQTIFSEAVGLASYNNRGKSGWSMAVVNGNGVVNTILAISDYSVYDLCTIACGTNDFKLNVPLGQLGTIGDTVFDDTTFYGAYRKAVEYILTKSPVIRIVLMTPLQRDNDGYDVNYTNSAGHKLIDYVNAVREIGEMYGLPVCDMYANSGFTKKTLAAYTLDGLHPNATGYIRMGNYLTGFLNAIGT